MPFIRSVWAVILLLLLAAGPAAALDLTVLHVNDSHSYLDTTPEDVTLSGQRTTAHLGGWARLDRAVAGVRAPGGNVVLLHAGDAVQGGLYFMKYGGVPEMQLLDRLGVDAMTLGNHEFDRGAAFLADMLGHTSVPILAANVDARGVPDLAGRVRPMTILDVHGDKVGVIGLTLREVPSVSSPGPGVTFEDEALTARRCVAELEARGVDKIILLTHVGLERDMQLAARVPGVDLIVGGHSHTLLGDEDHLGELGLNPEGPYPVVVKGPDGGDVFVVTAWKWARVLGRIDVHFDDAGHVTRAEAAPVLLLADEFERKDSGGVRQPLAGADRKQAIAAVDASLVAEVIPDDGPTTAFLAPFRDGVEAMGREVLGRAVADIPHTRAPGRTQSDIDLPQGSLLGPLVAASMLDRLAGTGDPADLAMLNAGGVRESLNQGDITVGTVLTMLPFGNTLFALTVTGADFRAALEHGVTRGGGAFPCVAGVRYAADINRPEGQRVTAVEAFKGGSWSPLKPDMSYRLVTNSFLARGGDGYAMLAAAGDRCDTGFGDAQAFMDYVRRLGRLVPPQSTGVTYTPAK
jgi:5'-nucleotidase